MNNYRDKEQELSKYTLITILLTCCFGVPVFFQFATGNKGFQFLLVYIVIMIFTWKWYAKKYYEIYNTSILQGSVFDNTTKQRINPNKYVNREAGNFYAHELVKARKNNDIYKAYECATKIIESVPNYALSYCQRALIVVESLYYDKNKLEQAIEDIKYAYTLGNSQEDVVNAINSLIRCFIDADLKDNVTCLENIYNSFPEIAIMTSRPIEDFDPSNYSLVKILNNILNSCNNYIDSGYRCSFLYIRRSIVLLTMHGVNEIDLAVEDLLQSSKVNSNGIFSSFARIECFDYILCLLNSDVYISKILDKNIQELEAIVKTDIQKVESGSYRYFSERLQLIKNNMREADNYVSLKLSSQVPIPSAQAEIKNNTDNNVNAPVNYEYISKGRELDI